MVIVCKLIGGLGNQMFQYAYSYNLSKIYGENLCFDTSFYNGTTPKLLLFNLEYKSVIGKDLNLSDWEEAVVQERRYRVLQKFIRTINHEKIGDRVFNYFSQKGYYFNFDPFYYNFVKTEKVNKYIYGYFQSEKYFEKVSAEIKKQYTYDGTLSSLFYEYKKQILKSDCIALHIRLGDYKNLRNKYLDVCSDLYYENAILYMKEKFKKFIFIIFTNDIGAAKMKKYIPDNSIFVSGTSDIEDLILLSYFKRIIMSASTFSWWGSYLGRYKDKVIIAPDKWMRTLREDAAIYRNDMIKIVTGY